MASLGFTFEVVPHEQTINLNDGETVQSQIRDAFHQNNINLPQDNVVIDSNIHRFSANGNKKDKSGWYVFTETDGITHGSFGSWRDGVEVTFRSESYKRLIHEERLRIDALISQQREAANQERIRVYAEVSQKCTDMVNSLPDADLNHPYIAKKRISGLGLKQKDKNLILPVYNPETGQITSVQYINEHGAKWFYTGGETKGMMNVIHGASDIVFIAEGYATAATIFEQTGNTTYIAFNAGNLESTVKRAIANHPMSKVVLCGDNDKPNKQHPEGTGQYYGNKISQELGIEVLYPPETGTDFNDFFCDGGDVLSIIKPKIMDDFFVDANDLIQQPAPLPFLINGIIPESSLGMIHGVSGGGKTFVVLDMCYHVAMGMDWHGKKTNNGGVVYLAGEGNYGLRSRLAGLNQKHGSKPIKNFVLSKGGCDLNKHDGFVKVTQGIESLPFKPKMIIVDTLHRFLNGDENSAQDTKGMIDACDRLKELYNCTVILVHHTGISETAQERARGSSAWRGAMDFEYNVKPQSGKVIFQCKKMKDSEEIKPMIFDFNKLPVNGWVDHDTGETIHTRTIDLSANQEPPKPKDKKEENEKKENINTIKAVWRECGKIEKGQCYFTRNDFINYAETFLEMTNSKAVNMARTEKSRFIGKLIDQGILEKLSFGDEICFFICDAGINFSLINANNTTLEDNEVPF